MDRIGVSYDYLGSGGTFATPQRVLECLRDLGYNQIHKCNGYSLTQIKNMLYDHKPVFIAALGLGGGHAWVIDGIKTRTIQDENSETESREQVLLHCNWGWDGSSNGYYESKIFDTIDGTVEYDEYSANASQLSLLENEYSFWFRILTY